MVCCNVIEKSVHKLGSPVESEGKPADKQEMTLRYWGEHGPLDTRLEGVFNLLS